MTTIYRSAGKRLFDVLVVVLASPLIIVTLGLIWCAVRLRLGAPALFEQDRAGLHGRVFKLRKFRTMTSNTDSMGQLLPDADRLTPLGRWLRSTSLDELPELWNVLMGDMSLVGPRPLLVRYLPRYSQRQSRRHEALPGVTGLAQIRGRNAASWEQKFEWDVEYVDTMSFSRDLMILVRTALVVLRRDGVSQSGHATMEEFRGSK